MATDDSRSTYLLVFDGLADWEPSYALTGLRHWAKLPVRTVGFDKREVTTMAGLRVSPDIMLADMDLTNVALFMLPGGDMWESKYPREHIENVLCNLEDQEVPIAGICAATIAIARAGLFAGRRHTSNGRAYLQAHARGYLGADNYVETRAVRDERIISATGLGALEFAREVFAELRAFTDTEIVEWYEMYRTGRQAAASGPA
jgi:putative intracellular protease/amidase